eukprot:2201089-Pleurochrysis_carterae.AAC.1
MICQQAQMRIPKWQPKERELRTNFAYCCVTQKVGGIKGWRAPACRFSYVHVNCETAELCSM